MRIKAILSMAVLVVGCSGSQSKSGLVWEEASHLPAVSGSNNIGVAGPIAGIIQDKLIVAAGANFPNGLPWDGGKKVYQSQGYIYSISGSSLKLDTIFNLEEGIAYPANLSLSNSIYIAGGENENGPIDQVAKYELSERGKLEKKNLKPLPVALTNAGLAAGNNEIFFIGGENAESVSDQVYSLKLDDSTANWMEYMKLPYPVSHAVVLGNGKDKIYVIGGRKKNPNAISDIYDGLLELDLNTKSVRELTKLPKALAAGTGVYKDGKIYVFGGDDGSTFSKVEEAIANIAKENDPLKKEELTQAKNKLQAGHPGFSKENWVYELKTGSWSQLEGMETESPVTTSAVIKENLFFIPSGEVRAGVRTDQILVGQIK